MNVLVPVEEIRKLPESIGKGAQLGGNLANKRLAREPARHGGLHQTGVAQELTMAQRCKASAHRSERRGQCDVETDRDPLFAGVERLERVGFFGGQPRRRHHHRSGIDPAAQNEFTNRVIDARRKAVVISAKPDLASRVTLHASEFHSAARGSRRPRFVGSLMASSALLIACSATK